MSGGEKEAGDRAEELHHDEDEEDFIDHRDEGDEEGLLDGGGGKDEFNEVDGDRSCDKEKEEGDKAVGEGFASTDEAIDLLAERGLVKLRHRRSLAGRWSKASELAMGGMELR